jgi:hypothetical protein
MRYGYRFRTLSVFRSGRGSGLAGVFQGICCKAGLKLACNGCFEEISRT